MAKVTKPKVVKNTASINEIIEVFNAYLADDSAISFADYWTNSHDGRSYVDRDFKIVSNLIASRGSLIVNLNVRYFEDDAFDTKYRHKYEQFIECVDSLPIDKDVTEANKIKSKILAPIIRAELETGKAIDYSKIGIDVEEFVKKYYVDLYTKEAKDAKDQPFSMKKSHPKWSFIGKKFVLPTAITAIITTIVGGIIGAVGTVGSGILSDSLLLNIASLAIGGGAIGLVATPIIIIAKDKFTKMYYAHKYGKTKTIKQLDNTSISLDNVKIMQLSNKFTKTEEKIKSLVGSKNPFKQLRKYRLTKINRNRLHELANTRYQLENHAEALSSDVSLEIKDRYIGKEGVVTQLKALQTSLLSNKRYADIIVAHWLGAPDKPSDKEDVKQSKKDMKNINVRKLSYIQKMIAMYEDLHKDDAHKDDDLTHKDDTSAHKDDVDTDDDTSTDKSDDSSHKGDTSSHKEEKKTKTTKETRLDMIKVVFEYKKQVSSLDRIAADVTAFARDAIEKKSPGKVVSITYDKNDILTFYEHMNAYEMKLSKLEDDKPVPPLATTDSNMLKLVYSVAKDYLKKNDIVVY